MENPNKISEEAKPFLFDGPIPGQSLTNSPEQKYPWEKAPQFTGQRELTEKIFLDLLKDENLESVLTLMANKTPVMDIAQMLLMTGFQKGKMNPDMMLTQLEPTAYMLLALAEKAGIKPVLARDDDVAVEEGEDIDVTPDVRVAQDMKNSVGTKGRFQDAKVMQVSPNSVGKDIKQKLAELDTSKIQASILQKPDVKPGQGLLNKPEVI